MAAPSKNKKYGLIKPNLQQPSGSFVARPSIFGDDSESDGDAPGGSDWVKKAFQRETEKSCQKKQTKLDMQRALEQDPTIYQYDEVYDKLEEKKKETLSAKKDVDRKPKYIASLLKQAEQRKRENERRTERQVQKEREAEGEEFKDKEAFVTSAYRAKLEEFSKQDEEERYRDQLEAFTDVSKQKDLSGFYRHLYRQTVSGDVKPDNPVAIKQEEAETDDARVVATGEETSNVDADASPSLKNQEEKSKRHYRKRKNSNSSADSNVDADDSLASSSSSDEGETPAKIPKQVKGVISLNEDADSDSDSESKPSPSADNKGDKQRGEDEDDSDEDDKENVENVKNKVVESKPKINIWEKRTVGALFDAAVERYYARKASR